MLPQALLARVGVLELRELDLQLALGRVGVLGEDVEDHRGAVDHPDLQAVLQVALLAGAERRPRRRPGRASRAPRARPAPPACPRPRYVRGTGRSRRCTMRGDGHGARGPQQLRRTRPCGRPAPRARRPARRPPRRARRRAARPARRRARPCRGMCAAARSSRNDAPRGDVAPNRAVSSRRPCGYDCASMPAVNTESLLDDTPDWYRDADHLRAARPRLLRQQRRRHRRLPRADREARLPRRTSASPRSGCCRSTRRRCATTATTSPTTRDVHPAYGDAATTSSASSREAHRRGLRVITELVLNHTSDQHPWFQRARRAPPGSRWRDFYVWSDTPERYTRRPDHLQGLRDVELDLGPGRRGRTTGTASTRHQPDLNFDNPDGAQARCSQVVDFWLRHGRRRPAPRRRALPVRARGHQLREPARDPRVPQASCARTSTRSFPDRMLLAEANQWPEDAVAYFGDGDECHMAFHFPLMPRLFMALQHGGPLPDHRHPRADAADPRRLPVGACSCATTTS